MGRIENFFYEYKYYIIGFLGSLLLIIGGLLLYFNWDNIFSNKKKVPDDFFEIVNNEEVEKIEEVINKEESIVINDVKVDIKGFVAKPGVYSLSSDSRVQDVIKVAGGLKWNADTSMINLSKKLFDEMVIVVYSKDEVTNYLETKKSEENKSNFCSDNFNVSNDACISKDNNEKESNLTSETKKVSLNSGTKEELMSLSGIGESKASDIINYRNTNNGFKTLEELMNVKGIGEAVFGKIKDNIIL